MELQIKRDPANITRSLTKKLFRLGHIGGGYARFCSGVAHASYEDIDIYPVHKNAVPAIEALLLSLGFKQEGYPLNYVKNSYRYQIVEKLTFANPLEVIDNMPSSVQAIVFTSDGRLLASKDFLEFESKKILNLNFDIKHQPSIDTYEVTIYKYINKGYKVSDESYVKLVNLLSQKSFENGGKPEAALGVKDNGTLCGWGVDSTNDDILGSAVFNLLQNNNPDKVFTTLEPDMYDMSLLARKNVEQVHFGLNNYIKNKNYFAPVTTKLECEDLASLPIDEEVVTYQSDYSACEEHWDLSGNYPIANFPVPCPSCRGFKTIPNRYRFHTVEGSPTKYRCAISYKCHTCSRTWWESGKPEDSFAQWVFYGVVIPEEMYKRVEKYYNVEEDGFIPPVTWRDIDNIE